MENEDSRIRRQRRNPSDIAILFSEYRASEMTAAEFCSSRQLHRPTFSTWLGRYKVKTSTSNPTLGFAAIQVTPAPGPILFAEVNGI